MPEMKPDATITNSRLSHHFERMEYAQILHDGSEVKILELDPNRTAQTIHMAGIPGALSLELPMQRPDVAVPVAELFLK